MRILLTGTNGFVGQHTYRQLISEGYEVLGLVGPGHAGRGLQSVDITNSSAVEAIVGFNKPNVVIHLAAQSSVHRSWASPDNTLTVNALGTLNLWMASAYHGVDHFVYISTAEVYHTASESKCLDEESTVVPTNPYGTSKLTAELLLRQLKPQSHTRLTILRPFNHIGPGQDFNFVIPNFARQLSEARQSAYPKIYVGNLSAIRDFLDVRDVARAYTMVAASHTISGTFNICSGTPRTIEAVLGDLIRVSKVKNVEVVADPARMRSVDVPVLVGNPERFMRTTGWHQRMDWDQTLRDIWASVAGNGE